MSKTTDITSEQAEIITDSQIPFANDKTERNKALVDYCKFQKEAANIFIKKDTQGYGYTYAQLDQLVRKIKPMLSDHNLCLIQTHQCDRVESRLLHINGTELAHSVIELRISQTNDTGKQMQNVGIASTYARRYDFLCVTGLAPADNDGVQESKKENSKTQAPTRQQVRDHYQKKQAVFDPSQVVFSHSVYLNKQADPTNSEQIKYIAQQTAKLKGPGAKPNQQAATNFVMSQLKKNPEATVSDVLNAAKDIACK